MSAPSRVDGVDYTPEGVESARTELIALRNGALAEFAWATLLSHVIAYLADYRELLGARKPGCEARLRALTQQLLGLAGSWEHQDRYFPSGPQYAVDLREVVGRHIVEDSERGDEP